MSLVSVLSSNTQINEMRIEKQKEKKRFVANIEEENGVHKK
jgi:hypothetical protein